MLNDANIWIVAGAAMITALFTGLGALPFLFVRNISDRLLGTANAAAAGLMLGASIGLVWEGTHYEITKLVAGIITGLLLVLVARRILEARGGDVHIGEVEGADAMQMLLIVGVMTVHSFAEGVGVGVSYGDTSEFGALISIAIAVHNIPEGIAISLVLIPRGIAVWRAAGWSIFSSLPQPLMAIPAYLFVLAFEPWLPFGLGLAAGAMIWMVFSELLPEALEEVSPVRAYSALSVAAGAMLLFQFMLSG